MRIGKQELFQSTSKLRNSNRQFRMYDLFGIPYLFWVRPEIRAMSHTAPRLPALHSTSAPRPSPRVERDSFCA